MTEQTDFVPPAAEGLPLGALDSATEGADRLNAWALAPRGRNFLAHALVQLARDGWLRPESGEGFEPMRDRETPAPQAAPAVPAGQAPDTDQAGLREEIAHTLAAADGWTWATGFDAGKSTVYQGYLSRADAVLAVLPAPAVVSAVPGQADDETTDEARCTCADAGACFAPAGHYADCPQADEQPAAGAQQPKEA